MKGSEKVIVYPGTFDPITNGHLSILNRALQIFDKLIIAILINPQKVALFSMEERIEMIREVLKDQPNVEVDSFNGLLVPDGSHESQTEPGGADCLLDDRLQVVLHQLEHY